MYKTRKILLFLVLMIMSFILMTKTVHAEPTNDQTNQVVSGSSVEEKILSQDQPLNVNIKGIVINKNEYDDANKDNVIQDFSVKIKLTKKDNAEQTTSVTLTSENNFASVLELKAGEYNIELEEKTNNIKEVTLPNETILVDGTDINFNIEYNLNFNQDDESESIFITFLKNNFIFLILLIACGVALFRIDYKKRNMK